MVSGMWDKPVIDQAIVAVRIGEINERLRCLQNIVPGCYKVLNNMTSLLAYRLLLKFELLREGGIGSMKRCVRCKSSYHTAMRDAYDFIYIIRKESLIMIQGADQITDKASMLDEAIEYLKSLLLQLQHNDDDLPNMNTLLPTTTRLIRTLQGLLRVNYPYTSLQNSSEARRTPVVRELTVLMFALYRYNHRDQPYNLNVVRRWLGLAEENIPTEAQVLSRIQPPHIRQQLFANGLAYYAMPITRLEPDRPNVINIDIEDPVCLKLLQRNSKARAARRATVGKWNLLLLDERIGMQNACYCLALLQVHG
ncbi:hypothetical protein COLO4_05908 [Corchorus olitorius]|uniref:Uncharacterized protein n=1 Tax=Corchorus olitorius TaxID=93759 RepID=A0A1R3KPI4_9ROSI|nr:hypothetical protein COLO4_05908 [Corchorus olitorius]